LHERSIPHLGHKENPMKRRPFISLFLILLFLAAAGPIHAGDEDGYAHLRQRMVERQIAARGVKDPRVLEAMLEVPRHRFVPERHRDHAYGDYPLPIGQGQTISQPYVVAYMTQALNLKSQDRVLEIGTGSGYQAAILAELVKEVYTIEIIETLGQRAKKTLKELGYKNVHVRIGDGHKGWPREAPFDAVIVTCAPDRVPEALVRQLEEGGRMIIPVGKEGSIQRLVRGIKRGGRLETKNVMAVRFVPMTR